MLVDLPLVLRAGDLLYTTNVDVQMWANQALLSDTNSGTVYFKLILYHLSVANFVNLSFYTLPWAVLKLIPGVFEPMKGTSSSHAHIEVKY